MNYPPDIFTAEQIKSAEGTYYLKAVTLPGTEGKPVEGWAVLGPGIKIEGGPFWPGADGERRARSVANALNVAYAYGDANGLTSHGVIKVEAPKRRRRRKNGKAKSGKT